MILSNQVRCGNCLHEPFSAHRHDFQYCTCGMVAVDGGMEYLRRVGDHDTYEDISILVDDEDYKGLLEAMTDETKNDLGKLCNIARYLRDEMSINIGEAK
jgi:hypothetical protein